MRLPPEKVLLKLEPIADKFHILKNLREGLKELMARKQKVLPEVEEVSSDGIPRLSTGETAGEGSLRSSQVRGV